MPEPRWLTPHEQTVWRSFLDAVSLINDEVGDQLQGDSDLSHSDYEIFVRLSEAPDRTLRMSELATRTLFSRSRLSHAVGRLEREGWVRREPCPGDKRGLNAILTDDGFKKLAAAAPGHVEAVRTVLLDQLSPAQVDQLGIITAAIVNAARARGQAEPQH